MHTSVFIYSLIGKKYYGFHDLGIMNKAAINIQYCMTQSFSLLEKISRSLIARSCSKTVFIFVKNCQTVLQRSYTILHSQQQWVRVPVATHSCLHLLLPMLWTLASLITVWVHLFLICGSLMTNDAFKCWFDFWNQMFLYVFYKPLFLISRKSIYILKSK